MIHYMDKENSLIAIVDILNMCGQNIFFLCQLPSFLFLGRNSKTIFLWRGINDPWQNHSCNLAVMRGRAVIRTRNAICSHWFIHYNIAVCPFSLPRSNVPQLLKIALPYWPILGKLNEHGNVSSRYCGLQRNGSSNLDMVEKEKDPD